MGWPREEKRGKEGNVKNATMAFGLSEGRIESITWKKSGSE